MLAMNVVSVWDSEALKILDDHFPSQCRLEESRTKGYTKGNKKQEKFAAKNFFSGGLKNDL
jgi:hypothetical protein